MSEVHDDAATLPPLISVTDKHLPGAKNTAYKRWLDVKTQYQQWDVQRMAQPNPQSVYPVNQELRYPIYSQSNGFNSMPYGRHPMENDRMPGSAAPAMYPQTHLMNSMSQINGSLMEARPRFSDPTRPVSNFRPPESYFDASRTSLDKEKLPFSPNEHYGDAEHRETKSERSRRRHRSRSKSRSRSPERERSCSPDSKKSSRSRNRSDDHSRSRRELSPSPTHQDSPNQNQRRKFEEASPVPVRRDSRSDSSGCRRDSSSLRDSSPRSSFRNESASNRRESPERKEDRRRKFTEEPKKRRKFSEDPRLLEQSKAKESVEQDDIERTTLEMLQGKSNSSKLQFRSKKTSSSSSSSQQKEVENTMKTKSILKMAPPPMVPILPPKSIGKSKSVRISPAGLAAKKKTSFKEDIFMPPPPPIGKLKPPSPPQPQQKVLRMGALSTLAMYEDSDEDD